MRNGAMLSHIPLLPYSAQTMDRLLTLEQITTMLGISRSTLLRRIQEGVFPAAIHITPKVRRWSAAEVEQWFQNLVAAPRSRPTKE